MSDDLAKRAQQVLEDALAHPEDERDRFLAETCGDEPALLAEVRSLLAALGKAASFLETPAVAERDAFSAPRQSAQTFVGSRIGRYRIDSVIASGGMGTVYLAEQEHPRRSVALKVLRAGLVSQSAQRRFEYEAQILARLRHPNIAQIFDAGTHVLDDSGDRVPFFAMEHIADARSVTAYADAHDLGLEDRLRLFARICDAVHHGHQKGIIHRDIKPANLLVDDTGEPKVIDFGIARMDDDESPVTRLVTGEGQLIGTLQYMSPEQCAGRPGDIDTRTDVYSLGVVLYELLCRRPPYDVGTGTVLEGARIVCERTPDRPTTVNPALRGDLETIVLTALSKDVERRYQSAANLAVDIRRFLAATPIEARPPSMLYEMRLFARRNARLVMVAAIALVALVAGSVTSLAFGIRASREAEERARAEQVALHEASVARSVSAFLEGVLQQANPQSNPLGRELTLREALEIAAEVIPDDEPEVAGAIHRMLGVNFRELGALELSEHHLAEAQRLLAESLGTDQPATIETMNELALTLIEARRLDDAITQLESTLPLARELPAGDQAVLFSVLNNMGLVHLNRNDPSAAEPYLREGIDHDISLYGRRHPEVVTMMHNMGGVYLMQGKLEEAEEAFVEALELRRETHGSVHPAIPQSISALAHVRTMMGKTEGLDEILRESIDIRRELYGDSHPLLARSMNNLVAFLRRQDRHDEAVLLAREALDMFKATLPAGHPDTYSGLVALGSSLSFLGEYEEAERHLLEAWSMVEAEGSNVPAARRRPTIDHIVALYEVWDQPDEADRWRAMVDERPAE